MWFFKSKDKKIINELVEENIIFKKRIKELEERSEQKDNFFKELMSDGLRHKSSLAAKHMSDRKKYINNKY